MREMIEAAFIVKVTIPFFSTIFNRFYVRMHPIEA
jgi:hypothetical protein